MVARPRGFGCLDPDPLPQRGLVFSQNGKDFCRRDLAMSGAIIIVENLGKKYRISHQGERQRYVALRDVVANKVMDWFRTGKSEIGNRKSVEDFWALKDVLFGI